MKAKYAIKGLLRIHAVQQTRKMFSIVAQTKRKIVRLMQIGFMQFVHKHQFYAVTERLQSALATQSNGMSETQRFAFKGRENVLETKKSFEFSHEKSRRVLVKQ
jgi:hypothetical protein